VISPSPLLVKLGFCAFAIAAAWAHGYHYRAEIAARDEAALNAVAMATEARYRSLEKETADAQAGYVEAFRRNRDASAAEWVRIKAASRRDVPAIPTQCGSAPADPGAGLEEPRATAREVTEALAVASDLGATLRLCQQELRQCAEMR
jgi:hypothetical protein